MELVGHQKQRALLSRTMSSGSLPQSLLFSGVSGIGKRLIAKRIAKLLLCESPNYEALLTSSPIHCPCPSCRVFEAGNAPDFHCIDCSDRKENNTDEIRKLLSSLHLKSFSGAARVVILDEADQLGSQSSNALLKILEEPKPNLYFILIARSRTKVLPTILSRCLCIHFERLDDAEILSLLPAHARLAELDISKLPQGVSLPELAALADGSFENVQSIVEYASEWNELKQSLKKLTKRQMSVALEFASELSSKKEQLGRQLALLRIAVRSQLLKAAHSENASLSASWALLLQGLIDADRCVFERNFSAQYVLQALFSEFVNSLNTPCSSKHPQYLHEMVL